MKLGLVILKLASATYTGAVDRYCEPLTLRYGKEDHSGTYSTRGLRC